MRRTRPSSRTRLLARLTPFVAAPALLLACDGSDDPTSPGPAPAEVVVTPVQATLTALGETVALTAVVLDQDGEPMDATVQWSSLDESVVTVSAAGVATAAGPGSTEVRAQAGSASGSAQVQVVQDEEALDYSVAVEPASVTLPEGGTATLTATVTDALGRDVSSAEVVWTSLDEDVVTVDAGGTLTAVAAGDAEVTASFRQGIGTASVTVVARTDGEETALRLTGDATVGDIAGGIAAAPELVQALSDVAAELQAGDVAAARVEIDALGTRVDELRAAAAGVDAILLAALDLVVRAMERALAP